jgi:hypothetical protein
VRRDRTAERGEERGIGEDANSESGRLTGFATQSAPVIAVQREEQQRGCEDGAGQTEGSGFMESRLRGER